MLCTVSGLVEVGASGCPICNRRRIKGTVPGLDAAELVLQGQFGAEEVADEVVPAGAHRHVALESVGVTVRPSPPSCSDRRCPPQASVHTQTWRVSDPAAPMPTPVCLTYDAVTRRHVMPGCARHFRPGV